MVLGINSGDWTILLTTRLEIVNLRFGNPVYGCIRYKNFSPKSNNGFQELIVKTNDKTTFKKNKGKLSIITIESEKHKLSGLPQSPTLDELLSDRLLQSNRLDEARLDPNVRTTIQIYICPNFYPNLDDMPNFDTFRDDFTQFSLQFPNSRLIPRYSIFINS